MAAGVACVDTGLTAGPGRDAAAAGDATSDAGGAGAALLAPPPGSVAPLNLAAVVVELEEPAPAMLALVDAAGVPLETSPRIPAPDDPRCAGRAVGTCVVVDLAEPLSPAGEYRVLVDDVDTGLRIAAGAEWDLSPPGATALVAPSDGCVVARIDSDEPSWASLRARGRTAPSPGVATAHEAALAWEEGDDGALVEIVLAVEDLAGNRTELAPPVVTAVRSPGWSVSEVLANPAGPEPAQEWVELVRLGDAAGSLGGLRLGDGSGVDALPDVTVEPGGRALVVPSGWDPAAPGDVAPAPGTVIARIEGTTLGLGGLANGGESVTLWDASGTPISIFTAYFDTSGSSWNGRSVERRRPGDCDVAANAAPNAAHSSTPGARNSVE